MQAASLCCVIPGTSPNYLFLLWPLPGGTWTVCIVKGLSLGLVATSFFGICASRAVSLVVLCVQMQRELKMVYVECKIKAAV